MSEYSPSPWKVVSNPYYREIVSDEDGTIADACSSKYIGGNPIDGYTDKSEANARLIAAAPELLEALEFMFEQITNEKNASYTFEAYTRGIGIHKARIAIAKAKGE